VTYVEIKKVAANQLPLLILSVTFLLAGPDKSMSWTNILAIVNQEERVKTN
jgi:hypothetical protein